MKYMKVRYTKSGNIRDLSAESLFAYQELSDSGSQQLIRVTDENGNTLDIQQLDDNGWLESKVIDQNPDILSWMK